MQHALASLLGVVQRTIRNHAMLSPGQRVLVAVSGGPDSTGILLALAKLRRKLGIELVAAHVHHGLRGLAADLDEAAAAEAAARLGVSFVRAALPAGLGEQANLEARARALRYAALRRLAAEQGCTRVATGHTLDDQAETVLMRIVRGSGGRGLGAIRPRRADGVIRPLLDCRRVEVEAVVRAAGLDYRVDESNRDPRFLRTRVREQVLPLLAELNPSIVGTCANLAAAARAERRIVGAWVRSRLADATRDGALDVAWLRRLAPALRPLVVRHWLLRAGVPAAALGVRHTDAVLHLGVRREGGGEAHLPGGWTARRAGTLVYVEAGRPAGAGPPRGRRRSR